MMPYQVNSYQPKTKLTEDRARLGLILMGLAIVVLLLLLIGVLLLLPPISLLSRFDPAYTTIGREGGDVQETDGTMLSVPAGAAKRSFRVKLSSVPRNLFLEGAAGAELLTAAESIPPNLVLKSPFYQIDRSGPAPQQVSISVPIPNEAEPYSTLDLYTWTGTTWQWLPSHQILADDVIEAELDFLPGSVVAMQTQPARPHLAVSHLPGDPLPTALGEPPLEVNPLGFYLENEGMLVGDPSQIPPELQNPGFTLVPTLRNWYDDGTVRSDLIDNLLISPDARRQHIGVISGLLQSNGYGGIDLDYRGINPELRREYTAFLQELRAALPSTARLSVHVDLPAQVAADSWDTGAYDWPAISRVADAIRLPPLVNPKAYAPGGQMEMLLTWGVGQVDRYKLQLELTTQSTEQVNGVTRSLAYPAALQTLGTIGVAGGATTAVPGQVFNFTLSGLPASTGIQFDPDSGIYWFTYLDSNNAQHIVYLENAASIARKLQYVPEYNLGGVAVPDLFHPGGDPQVQEVVSQFLNLFIPPVESRHGVVWQVFNQQGGLIAEQMAEMGAPGYQWVAPAAPGAYQVKASITPNRTSTTVTPLGSITITVNAQ